MNARLFQLDYENLLKDKNPTKEGLTFILDNFLRFDFLIEERIKETDSLEIKNNFKEGLSSIRFAENFLLNVINGDINIEDNFEDYEYIIGTLHKGLKDIYLNEKINEDKFSEWLNSKSYS